MVTWHRRTVREFCLSDLRQIIKGARENFYPPELHRYPFPDGTPVIVYVSDVTKLGGREESVLAEDAEEVFCEMADRAFRAARGNATIGGSIRDEAAGVIWKIPPFGRRHVAFLD